MFCGKCGNQISAGVRFCGKCGWQVPNVEQVPSKPVCKSCGAELKEGIKFCGVCGAKVESDVPESAPAQSVPPVTEQVRSLPQTSTEPVKEVPPQPQVEQPKAEVSVEAPAESVAKTVSRLIRLTTPDGTMEFKSTGKADDSFLCGLYKIEVLADDEPCGSAECVIENKEE